MKEKRKKTTGITNFLMFALKKTKKYLFFISKFLV